MVAEAEPSFFADPKRIVQTLVAVVLLVVAIYVLIPRLFDLEDAIDKIGDGDPLWIVVGIVCCFGMFAAYVALFRGVVGRELVHLEWRHRLKTPAASAGPVPPASAAGRP